MNTSGGPVGRATPEDFGGGKPMALLADVVNVQTVGRSRDLWKQRVMK